MLDRLSGTPVAVYDAAWNLLLANPPYAALMGDPSGWRGLERNSVWRAFAGPGSRARFTPEERRLFEESLVGDLRETVSRYPADPGLRRLVAELRPAAGGSRRCGTRVSSAGTWRPARPSTTRRPVR
ncbi:hypothetical protein SFUMM280S_04902 [Streptomyces fumanus]